jgi:hypothetical protein
MNDTASQYLLRSGGLTVLGERRLGGDHAAIGVADEDDVSPFREEPLELGLDHVHVVLPGALRRAAVAGHAGAARRVPVRVQQAADCRKVYGGVPCAGDEEDGRCHVVGCAV